MASENTGSSSEIDACGQEGSVSGIFSGSNQLG